MRRYSIGIDYGTLSGRAVLVDVETGEERASAVYDYPHGVMDECLPDGRRLGPDWALQYPQDYLDVLAHTIPALLRQAGAKPEEVVGVGTDFTACTVLPVKADGTPLCFLPEYAGNPHAYVKLWKHHAIMALARMGVLPFALTRTTVLGVLPAMPTISGQSQLNALLIKLNRMQ